MSAISEDTKDQTEHDTPIYAGIAVVLCMIVLFLGLESTIAPVVFMLGMIFPIVYNFGTNVFLGEISYITKALAVVLQLAVTLDYSIFLLHRYQEEKQKLPNEEAMAKAIKATFTSITSSSISLWLHDEDGINNIKETLNLTDVKNIKSNEKPSKDGNTYTWNAKENDVYYEGTATKTTSSVC